MLPLAPGRSLVFPERRPPRSHQSPLRSLRRLAPTDPGNASAPPARGPDPHYSPTGTSNHRSLSTHHGPIPESERNAPVPLPLRLPLHDASAGTQQSTCNREPVALTATSLPHPAG